MGRAVTGEERVNCMHPSWALTAGFTFMFPCASLPCPHNDHINLTTEPSMCRRQEGKRKGHYRSSMALVLTCIFVTKCDDCWLPSKNSARDQDPVSKANHL